MLFHANKRGYLYYAAAIPAIMVGTVLFSFMGIEVSIWSILFCASTAMMSLDYLHRARLPGQLGIRRFLSPSLGGSIYWVPVWIIPLAIWALMMLFPPPL